MKRESNYAWWLLLILGIIGMIVASIYTLNHVCLPTIKSLVEYKVERRKEFFDWKKLPILEHLLSVSSLVIAGKIIRVAVGQIGNKREEESSAIDVSERNRIQDILSRDCLTPELLRCLNEKPVVLKIPPRCTKCKYWHGQVHGNNLLVCGLHPYGRENCPDFELETINKK